MKVLILNHYASIPEFSSAETRHYEIGKRLASSGHEITIVIGDYSHLLGKRWTELMKTERFEYDGVNFLILKARQYEGNSVKRFLSSLDYCRNGRKILNEFREFDVVIASSPHPFTWCLGSSISKRFGIPMVIEVRDVWPDDLIKSGTLSKNHPVSIIFRWMCKKYYPVSRAIISLLPEINDHLKSLNLKRIPPVFSIPNGLDIKSFNEYERCSEVDEIFSKILEGPLKIVYTGSHGPSNGLTFVVESIKNLPSDLKNKFVFLFIGRGPLKEELMKISEGEENIRFFDPIPKRCIPYLLREKSDVLLFSLANFSGVKYPAFSSFKLLDYLASGKPILSVYHEGLILRKAKGVVFYKYGDFNSFVQALNQILKNYESLKKEALSNINYVSRERDWNKLSEDFERLLYRLLEGSW